MQTGEIAKAKEKARLGAEAEAEAGAEAEAEAGAEAGAEAQAQAQAQVQAQAQAQVQAQAQAELDSEESDSKAPEEVTNNTEGAALFVSPISPICYFAICYIFLNFNIIRQNNFNN